MPGARYATPSAAAAVARDGDTVRIAAGNPASTLLVQDSVFLRDGSCAIACAHGIHAGPIARLVVRHSRFFAIRAGHHIKSRARATGISDCDIADGPEGTASYLIDIPNGGEVRISGNTLEKGPRSDNPGTAIMLGAEGVTNPTPAIRITANRLTDDGAPTVFVRNRTRTQAVLTGNVLTGKVTPLAPY